MKYIISAIAFLAFGANPVPGHPEHEADRVALLEGVRMIDTDGMPGGVTAFGPDAFAVVAGKDGPDAPLPVVAAARWGEGRVVAFGHDGFLRTPRHKDNGALLVNAGRWTSGGVEAPVAGVFREPALAAWLDENGFDVRSFEEPTWARHLDGVSTIFINGMWIAEADLPLLEEHIRGGGGLVTGVTGWGWMQIRGKDRAALAGECAANVLIQRAGLAFTSGARQRTRPDGYAAGVDLAPLNASEALLSIVDHGDGVPGVTPAQLARCSAVLADAVRSLPSDDRILLPKLAVAVAKTARVPTPSNPIRASDSLARLALTLDLERLRSASLDEIRAHPASFDFPGKIAADAPRIAGHALEIDASVTRWHSTGCYAAPGEPIEITIPAAAAGRGLGVRIGCHTDTLWHLEEWKRAPEITRRDPLDQPRTLVASPFGGLVYIEVPDGFPLKTVDVTISGALEAPTFTQGKSDLQDWVDRIRHLPAPWAELETEKVVLSVPSEKIRELDDPAALLDLWDRVLDAQADLAGVPRERLHPERIVPDVQISAGYMHSGYPIMTWLDHSVETSLSVENLAGGSWGHFHELGHNHQSSDWTFDGTVEVTCNLFTLYTLETVCGLRPGEGHPAMEPGERVRRLRSHLSRPDKFDHWKSDPFLALTMYLQLRTAFGWETYKSVFKEYRNLPAGERPKSDDEKRDQWLVRFSRASGRNLGPFFEAWGVPTTPAARQSVAHLPEWMPDDWPQP